MIQSLRMTDEPTMDTVRAVCRRPVTSPKGNDMLRLMVLHQTKYGMGREST